MRFVSLYSNQLVIFGVLVGIAGFLIFTQRRLKPGDYDRFLGGILMTVSAVMIGFVLYANATSPFVR